MTKEELIKIARQSGVRDDEHIFEFSQYKYLERFAELIVEKEREDCKKFFAENDTNLFWGSQVASHICARGQE